MQRRFVAFNAFDAIFSCLVLLGFVNFGYHALQGEHGLFALMRIESEEAALRADLDDLLDARERLENITARLSPDFLDLDLLDERARAVQGHIRADEITPR